jgi:hypothetical protein
MPVFFPAAHLIRQRAITTNQIQENKPAMFKLREVF